MIVGGSGSRINGFYIGIAEVVLDTVNWLCCKVEGTFVLIPYSNRFRNLGFKGYAMPECGLQGCSNDKADSCLSGCSVHCIALR